VNTITINDLLATGYNLDVGKNINDEIYVKFKDSKVKDGMFLSGVSGVGNTFDEAINDYYRKIKGKTLVFNEYEDYIKEVYVL